jgi:hypothetical protein
MRMFSEPALKAFRQFLETDRKTRASGGSPQGAFDISGRELKAAMARDAAIEKSGASMLDPDTLNMVMKCITEAFGEDASGAVAQALARAWPGSMGDGFDNPDDTAMDDDPEDFSPAAQFAKSAKLRDEYADGPEGAKNSQAMDDPPPFLGMPKPGGGMVGNKTTPAQDAAFRAAEKSISAADEYHRAWPSASRIRVI